MESKKEDMKQDRDVLKERVNMGALRAGESRRSGVVWDGWAVMSRIGVSGRIGLMLFVLVLIPMTGTLALLETKVLNDPINMLVVSLAVALGLLGPISRLGASFLVLNDIRAVNDFCSAIRQGHYGVRFSMGAETDDESEFVCLRRNLNWMAHHIETQTRKLSVRLDETVLQSKRYEEMSFRDALTGLYNRRYFDQILPELLDSAPKNIFLALIDCDSFKCVNDTHGHQAGDDVLVELGRSICASVREHVDFPFRFGGDEFGVIFRNLEFHECLAACERIRERFATTNGFGCTISIGLAIDTTETQDDGDTLLAACDAALYRAKGLGGNRTAVEQPFAFSGPPVSSTLLC